MKDQTTILAVDDTSESLALLVKLLTQAGYQVRPADSGELALAAVAAHPPDLILLDVRMKGVDGLDVCRRLKAREETRHIPIILISAFADVEEWVEGLQLGAADYITKPFQPEELLTRVKTHLALSRVSVSLEQQTAALRQTNEQLQSEIVKRQRVEEELRQSLDGTKRSRRAMLSALEDQKWADEALRESESSLQGILRSTADGILAISSENKVLYANEHFMEMWRIPPAVAASKDVTVLLQCALDQLSDPQGFLQKVQELDKSKEESLDTLYFKDGRVFERLSRPLLQEAELRGRVWSFHDATKRKQAEKLQDAIYRIAQAADHAESLDSLYPTIHAIIREVMVADNFYIALYDEKNDLLSFPYSVDELDPPAAPKKPGKGLTEYVLRTAKSLLCDEALFEGLVQRGEVELVGGASPIWLGAPLIVEGKAIGIMAVQDYANAQAYSEREQHILEFVSSQAAMAIHRKQAEEALRESEEKFRNTIQQASDGIRISDEQGRIVEWNTSQEAIFGLPREKMIGTILWDFLYSLLPEDERNEEAYQRLKRIALNAGQTENAAWTNRANEMQVVSANGEVKTVQVTAFTIGTLRGPLYASLTRDITERKRAEQALMESSAQFRVLFEASPDAIMLIDPRDNWPILDCNTAACQMNGYTRDELIGQSIDVLNLTPGHPTERAEYLERIRRNGVLRLETCHRRKDGIVFPVEVSTSLITLGGRDVILGIDRDITERKQAEDDLRKSESRNRTLVNAIPDIMFRISRDGTFLDCKANRGQLYLPPESFLGKKVVDVLPPEVARQCMTAMAGSFETGPQSFEYQLDMGNSSLHYEARVEANPNTDEAIFIIRDITERKRAEEQLKETLAELERSNAELQQFAYVASHDLQEPLRMVTSYLQLLAKRYQGRLDSDADEFIGFAVDGAQRMQRLIADLLAYSRAGTRGQPLQLTDGEAVLQQALHNLQITLEENQAQVTHDPLPTVLADKGQLVQVFQNLIGNGCKFHGDAPPHVHISARQTFEVLRSAPERSGAGETSKVWEFSVRDNGIGIEPQQFERIFMVFQRLHTQAEYSGSGIGLAICKKIVERNGGRLWVESQPGQGSTFYFTLPAGQA